MLNGLTPYMRWWRTIVTRDREVVEAVVDAAHAGPSADLRAALDAWPGLHYWSNDVDGRRLVLIRRVGAPQRERWWLHGILFLITFLTVWMGGAYLANGSLPLDFPLLLNWDRVTELVDTWSGGLAFLPPGLDFAMALMAILLAHESGHYLRARWYGINASPPYFLPAPPPLLPIFFIGTFGAFIRLRHPVVDRRQLMDVGAAGPWAGFVIAMVALIVGLQRSHVMPEVGAPSDQYILLAANYRMYLGSSLLMDLVREWVVGEGTVLLHPLAFAGWIGLFVTMLNLLPLGQLDGGHVLYSLVGERQSALSALAWVGLIVLGFVVGREAGALTAWFWWTWAIVIVIFGRGRVGHPSILDRHRPLPASRHALGWVTMGLFVATFVPVPVYYL
jgi:hypothetical protein